jgi:hypothetical protein
MQFNEFNRRLEKADLSPEAGFLLIHMFEVQVEFSRYLDQTTDLMEKLASRLMDMSAINADLIKQVRELKRRGMMDGIDVHSVVPDPEDGHG